MIAPPIMSQGGTFGSLDSISPRLKSAMIKAIIQKHVKK